MSVHRVSAPGGTAHWRLLTTTFTGRPLSNA
jgi:hypothetical protein